VNLTADEEADAQEWFAGHGVGLCRCDRSYDLAPALYTITTPDDDKPIPLLVLFCRTCGRTALYNARIMGLFG
jgi:hypothetical protein